MGTAAAGAAPGPSPQHSPAEVGGGCLTSATAQPWQVQDGRRRPEQLSAKCRAAWQQPRPALSWLPTSLYSLVRPLPLGRELPGIGRLPWPAFGWPQIRHRSMEICRPSPDPSQWATALFTESPWLKSRDTSTELKTQSRIRGLTPAMAHQAGQAMERGGTGNLSPNLSHLP